MYVCMYICIMYVRICVLCMYVCMHVCMYVRMCVCIYVFMYVYMYYVCTYVCIMYVCTYVCTMYVCVYACMYICMYVCMYAHLYVCIYVLCMYLCVYYVCMYINFQSNHCHTARQATEKYTDLVTNCTDRTHKLNLQTNFGVFKQIKLQSTWMQLANDDILQINEKQYVMFNSNKVKIVLVMTYVYEVSGTERCESHSNTTLCLGNTVLRVMYLHS